MLEEQVKDLLAEFETLANEAGHFTYSCVFSVHLVEDEAFNAEKKVLLEKFEILNANIKQHCIKFSELPLQVVPQANVVDSFFIIHSLVDDLDNFSPHEFFSMKDQIAMLHDEFRTAQTLLKFIEATPEDDNAMKEPLNQIKDLAYETEYLISSHVVGNIHSWYLDLRLPSITQKIKLVCERLQQIKERQASQVIVHYGGEVYDARPATFVDDNHFVALQHNTTERILADLVGKPKSSRHIISIFGMPGLGKTTIANKLYDSSSASYHFDRRVWCVVSQTYSVRSLLINILAHTGELKKDEILGKSDAELGVDIHKSLKQRRYLIVLDDVWHSNAWYDLQRYLPDDGNGSRVIITSRVMDAAPDGSICHALPLFSDDQCWDLLEKRLFSGESCPPELLYTGKRIASKCSGMPLAVIVTAGILANLKREEDAWERVEKQLDAFLLDIRSDYRKILELSYEHLPRNMKSCFLYFAAFPEDAEISVNKLAWRWIAEGFIRENEGKSREQIAELYLLELVNRSLVIPGKRGCDGRIKKCRIHDLLRDICLKKASEENFINSSNELSINVKHQRSYLPLTWNMDSRPFSLHCRSLIGGLPDRSSCFQTRPLLKVLDLRPNKFQKFDNTSFDLPIKLRYLGVVTHLTKVMVANLANLEFINVVNSSRIELPSIILRMKKLRHLIVKKEATFEDDNYVSETTNLRTLLYACISKISDETILRDSPHLLKLKCKIGGTISPDFSFLGQLETLKLVFEDHGISKNVSDLNLPPTIKNLCLWNSKLGWNKMSLIGRLPNLRVLKLEMFAFVGEEWETSDGEFEELRFLKISQNRLKHWMSCSDNFPKLQHLVIERCEELVEIPCDLGNISTLQSIDIKYCLIPASLSAVQIEQEQRKYGNEELQVNITTRHWTKQELVALYIEKMEKSENALLSSVICTPERDFLVRNDGEQVKVNSLKGKVVGIYFSAFRLHCQLFAPKLAEAYNVLKEYGHFEIVFVSSDEDEDYESFEADFSKFPWLAIPFTDSGTRNKLDVMFDIQSIPHLVILDENGKVLTEDGVRIIEECGGGDNPFVPKCNPEIKQLKKEEIGHIKQTEEEDEANWNDSLESLLVSGTLNYVIDHDERRIPVSSLFGKTTMIFFAANWCPACLIFLPRLIQVYQEINEKTDNSLEVIFVSDDQDRWSFDEFFATMPWLALPFGDNRKKSMIRLYKVKCIPKVVIIGPTGKTVTVEGWELIIYDGAEAYPFTSERMKEIQSENDKWAELWPKKVKKELHEHELGLVTFPAHSCDSCNEEGYSWTYYCEVCDFTLHPKCALGDDYKAEMGEYWPKKVVKEVHELKKPEEEAKRNHSLESLLVSESLDYVIDLVGTKIPVSSIAGKTTMLFFAAHWCPPCQFVLPEMVQKYKYHANNEKLNNSIEVIFISCDKDQSSFDKFFTMMPWLALPFGDARIESLSILFKVKAIPMLITIEPTGTTATSDAWELINYPGQDAYPFTYEWVQTQVKSQQMVVFWPKKMTNKLHEHELFLVKQILYDCDGCRESGFDWSYKCEVCTFSLHPNCALRDDKSEVKEEFGDEEEKTGSGDGIKCCMELLQIMDSQIA